jgi:hypothetical protein
MTAKEVVDLKLELGVGADAPLLPKLKVFRFKKIRFPAQPVNLGNGRQVQFRPVKLGTGGFSTWGEFETPDEDLAKELSKLAKARSQYVTVL